jgi:hypothetical protein
MGMFSDKPVRQSLVKRKQCSVAMKAYDEVYANAS